MGSSSSYTYLEEMFAIDILIEVRTSYILCELIMVYAVRFDRLLEFTFVDDGFWMSSPTKNGVLH